MNAEYTINLAAQVLCQTIRIIKPDLSLLALAAETEAKAEQLMRELPDEASEVAISNAFYRSVIEWSQLQLKGGAA